MWSISRAGNAIVDIHVRAVTKTGSGKLSIKAGIELPQTGETRFTSPGHEWTLPKGFPITLLPGTIGALGVLPVRVMLTGSIADIYGSAAAGTVQRGTPPQPPDYQLEVTLEDIHGSRYKSKLLTAVVPG
jgi:hypothetical protein